MSTQPTDAELKAMWQLHAADIGGIFYYARAVLAKWGAQPTPSSAAEFALQALVAAGHVSQELVDKAMVLPGAPQPAHSGEPVAWRYRMSGDMQWQYTERKEQFSHASEVEALTNMQPVERELLTPEQRDALWESCKYDDGEEWTVDWEQIVDAVERHHRIGIKGGQHGVDT